MADIVHLLRKSEELLEDQWKSFVGLDEWFQSKTDVPEEKQQQWQRIYQLQEFFRREYLAKLILESDSLIRLKRSRRSEDFVRGLMSFLEKGRVTGKNLLGFLADFLGADRGILLSTSEEAFQVCVLDAVNLEEPNLTFDEFVISRTILRQTLQGRRTVRIDKVMEHDEYRSQASISEIGISSVLAVPILSDRTVIGILYFDTLRQSHMFSKEDQGCVESIRPLFQRLFLVTSFQVAPKNQVFLEQEKALQGLVGGDPGFQSALSLVEKVAPTPAPVLLTGESGTGKELFARAIHALSDRRKRPFVPVNCAAIPDTLMESELFGHEKGAFTGADRVRIGKIEQANGGTLFLDEIGELKIELQAKLLRFLQSHEIERLGGSVRKVEVRIVSATNHNLAERVKTAGFREDLFYRLNVFPISLPPLRDRKKDIPILAHHFFEKYARVLGLRNLDIGSEVYGLLQDHDYPGNVRELENLVYRILVLSQSGRVTIDAMPPEFKGGVLRSVEGHPYAYLLKNVPSSYAGLCDRKAQLKEICRHELSLLERRFAESMVDKAAGNISEAARMAGIDRRQFYRLLNA